MKRTVSIIIALALALSCLLAIAEGSVNPYKVDESVSGTFTWWTFFDQAPFIKEQFELKYPNVTIDLQVFGGDEYQTKIMNVLSSGQGIPDMMDLEEGYVYKFLNSDAFVNLEELGLDELTDPVAFLAADVDRDGKITSADARAILRAAVSLEELA